MTNVKEPEAPAIAASAHPGARRAQSKGFLPMFLRPSLTARVLLLVVASLRSLGSGAADFAPLEKSILELQLAMGTGQTSAAELVDFYLERIARFDQQGPTLNSMAVINPRARTIAAALDKERQTQGPRGPLHGIPIVVKDNYQTEGMATEAGSLTLKGFAPREDAELVKRLRAAGAVILGKTNMHEFAYGIESIGSSFGVTRNPYDPSRNPGGSSGGTGAAVAANFAVAGLGSDTCGSIRIPAAHNALVGLRGTQGASSRRGIVPLSSTQDIGGPLARSVTDLALLLDVTTGYDPGDPQTAASARKFAGSFTRALNPDALRGTRIGVDPRLVRSSAQDEEMAVVFDAALKQLQALGAEVVEVRIAELDSVFEVDGGFYVLTHDFAGDINAYLASQGDAPVKSINDILARRTLVDSVQALVQASLDAQGDPPALYLAEVRKRDKLAVTLGELLAREALDALAYPALRQKPAKVGEGEGEHNSCQLAANSGFPAITVPAGFTPDGLPVGLELLGRPWDDAALLGFAYAFEQATQHRRGPAALPN